jgi:hypothetical protein
MTDSANSPKYKQLLESEPTEEPSRIDLQIAADMRKRSDDVLRTLPVNSPPYPDLPKPKNSKLVT